MSQWKALFGLKYQDRGDFPTFYSKLKGIIHQLKKGKSVAVTDGVFLKAYFTIVIESPKLQTEGRSFLKDPQNSTPRP